MIDSYLSINEKALRDAKEELTRLLRQDASKAGWPSSLWSTLNVELGNNRVVATYPEEIRTQIEDQEYGTGKNPPNSVIRRFEDKAAVIFADAVADNISKYLFESGKVL